MAAKKPVTLRFMLDNWYDDYESTRAFNGDVLALCSSSLNDYVNLPKILDIDRLWGSEVKRFPNYIYITLHDRPRKNSYFIKEDDGKLVIDGQWWEDITYNVAAFLNKHYPMGVYATVEYQVE